MSKHDVLLLGATGETGGDILEGLIEDGNFVRIIFSSNFQLVFLSPDSEFWRAKFYQPMS
jgi:uncharacterized protein YbjT (DUF2867 family)